MKNTITKMITNIIPPIVNKTIVNSDIDSGFMPISVKFKSTV